jgi:hypothetical protein
MKPSAKNPRVVVIPGLLGSALVDSVIKRPAAEARCAKHWDEMPEERDKFRDLGNELCGEESNSLWGRFPFLQWNADLDGWLKLMTDGDGYDKPGDIVRAAGPMELIIKWARFLPPYQVIPYRDLIEKLKSAGAQVLVFPYDWRLRAAVAVGKLNKAILDTWFGGIKPNSKPSEEKRVMLIGHSLGGLITRLFIEDPRTCGSLVVRHAVLVGVPHMGAPDAFGHFTGTQKFLQLAPEAPYLLTSTWVPCKEAITPMPPAARITPMPPATWSSVVASLELERLVKHVSSIIQLFPRYDFVEDRANRKVKEKYTKTFEPITHTPSKRTALEILGEMSALLREPASLTSWLSENDITYDIVSTIDLPTNVGMKRARNGKDFEMVHKKKGGDGTVPTFSSVGWLGDVDKLLPITLTYLRKGNNRIHPEMCQNEQVQKLCVERLKQRPPKKARARMPEADVPLFRDIARDIFLKGREPFGDKEWKKVKKNRTTVICFALIKGAKKGKPLFDPTTRKEGKLTRLVKDLKGIETPRVVYKGKTGRMKYQFVVLSPISTTTSGIVFLPARDEDYVHVFGIIATPWDDPHEDRLEGHAERRVQAFIDAQRDQFDWKGAIQDVFLWNESLTRPGGGFSPCASCCDSLATMWCPDGLKGRRLEWKEVYPGRGFKKENRTTKESLRLMEKAKPVPWGLTENHRPTT